MNATQNQEEAKQLVIISTLKTYSQASWKYWGKTPGTPTNGRGFSRVEILWLLPLPLGVRVQNPQGLQYPWWSLDTVNSSSVCRRRCSKYPRGYQQTRFWVNPISVFSFLQSLPFMLLHFCACWRPWYTWDILSHGPQHRSLVSWLRRDTVIRTISNIFPRRIEAEGNIDIDVSIFCFSSGQSHTLES